jgi:cellobiose phosphorylase
MRFGYFDDAHLEYVITQPDTPLPWINYLGTDNYFGIISNTAGGYSFYKDARLRRLIRFRYNNAPLDEGGRYVYIRDDSSPQPRYWSATWQPVRSPFDHYECRHGLGYTSITTENQSIRSRLTYFIPLSDNLEIWRLELTNQRETPAELSLFSAVEFCLWDAMDDATNFQRNLNIAEVEVENGVIYHKTEYRERRDHFAFFASSEPLVGFETSRDVFLGAYRGWDQPLAVEQGQTHCSIAHGWQPVGVHHIRVKLDPGETRTVIFLLGYHENQPHAKFDPKDSNTLDKTQVKPLIDRYSQPGAVEQAYTALSEYWRHQLAKFQVDTPDHHTNRMVNIWNAYQMMITYNFSRSASYFESGIGRGMGFRDCTQDLLGFVHLLPEKSRTRLLDLAATQLPDGGAYHQYQPMTKLGNHDIGGNFSDDPLWLVLAVAAYLKETGDWTVLNAPVPFDNQAGTEAPLIEHLRRSIQYTLDRIGPHGLPLIGRADWNDCLNLNSFSDTPGQSFQTVTAKDGKVAESVFVAALFMIAAREMEQITARLDLPEEAKKYTQAQGAMKATIDAAGWDGAWFRRAYDDYGHPVGSVENAEGQIFIEPQGICIIAGVGIEDGRARKALDAVAQHLAFEHGIVLLYPAYHRYRLELGEISSYPPGYKENGSVFCHTNPWIVIAETLVGNGDRAFDYYQRINPSRREEISEVHRCEPYVYAQTIAGKESTTPGEAKNSWLTGTAAWNFVALTQWILGIRPDYDGLTINPVLPSNWSGYKAVRIYRGKRYEIEVNREEPGNQPVIRVNGKKVNGNLVPFSLDPAENAAVNAVND